MTEYFVILKGMNKEFATAEFETLFYLYYNQKPKLEQISNVYYKFSSDIELKSEDEIFKRLTFTKHVSILNFHGNLEDLKKQISTFEISKHYEGKTFAVNASRMVKTFELPDSLRTLAAPVYDEFKSGKVSLKQFGIRFHYFYDSPENFYFVSEIYHNSMDYLERMPKYRPVVMPYTLKSDMARAAINLLGMKDKNSVLLDPFCGIGGILLEGYDMGFKILGNDISWNDLKYFKQNFEHYFPDSFKSGQVKRTLADSSTQFLKENSIDGIVSDIPYGKSCRRLGDDLYNDFLRSATTYLKPGAKLVIIYANFLEFKDIAKKYFTEVMEIDHYINKSMTRHILVLENNKNN
jgi:tRNA (guanine10-N2)-dimethyltransferase